MQQLPVNRALTHVAQEIAGLLQQSHPFQPDSIKRVETISIRAIEPEYRQVITNELLSARELEVLQLIVDEYNNIVLIEELSLNPGKRTLS